MFPVTRLRRLRSSPALRALVRESEVAVGDLVAPLFVKGFCGEKPPRPEIPDLTHLPLNHLVQEAQELSQLGIPAILLFGIPDEKDECGSLAYAEQGITQQAIRRLREEVPDLLIMADLCVCAFTESGHCGVWRGTGVDNDATLALLQRQAVSLARAGAQVIAPSGMMDGVIQALRSALDGAGYASLPLLGYSVKYHSSFYSPFRAVSGGAPRMGDRSGYQMDASNVLEALRETALDVQEGADLLMVKPAHAYLDVIARVKQAHPHMPLGAYHTSGECALLRAAAERGWVDEEKAVCEVLQAIRRAGADFIFTYYAKSFARWMRAKTSSGVPEQSTVCTSCP